MVAQIRAVGELEWGIGYLPAVRAGLGCMSRVDGDEFSPVFGGLPLQRLDVGGDGRILSVARHRGFGEEFRLEVLAGDDVIVFADALGPCVGDGRTLCGDTAAQLPVLRACFLVAA